MAKIFASMQLLTNVTLELVTENTQTLHSKSK